MVGLSAICNVTPLPFLFCSGLFFTVFHRSHSIVFGLTFFASVWFATETFLVQLPPVSSFLTQLCVLSFV